MARSPCEVVTKFTQVFSISVVADGNSRFSIFTFYHFFINNVFFLRLGHVMLGTKKLDGWLEEKVTIFGHEDVESDCFAQIYQNGKLAVS